MRPSLEQALDDDDDPDVSAAGVRFGDDLDGHPAAGEDGDGVAAGRAAVGTVDLRAGAIPEARWGLPGDQEPARLFATTPARSWGETTSPTTDMDPTLRPPTHGP